MAKNGLEKVASLDEARRHRLLQCNALHAMFDFENHIATLMLPWMECTDMSGAIEFCKRVDADVRTITTMAQVSADSGDYGQDTVYKRNEATGEWFVANWARACLG